jgi:hypothetical protein
MFGTCDDVKIQTVKIDWYSLHQLHISLFEKRNIFKLDQNVY